MNSHCTPDTTFGIEISDSQIAYAPVYTFIETGPGETQGLDGMPGASNSDPEHTPTVTSACFHDGKITTFKSSGRPLTQRTGQYHVHFAFG